jgi:glucokinase
VSTVYWTVRRVEHVTSQAAQAVIGIDLGGTKIAAAVLTPDGVLHEREHVPTEAEEGREHVIARLIAVVRSLQERTSYTVHAIGIGAPAPLSPSQGIIWEAPNMPGWDRVPLRDLMQGELSLPVALENDARAAGLAEARVGAGRSASSMLYVTVGTGIGGALLIDGRLIRGASETAGEIGHMVMNPSGPLCGCGNYGCLEQYSAGPAIERRAAELIREGAPSILSEIAADRLTGESVAEAARAGDAVGLRAYQDAGTWLGAGIASVVNLFNPATVVVGGGVAQTGDLLMSPVRSSVRHHSLNRAFEALTINTAMLGTDAGILGAGMAAIDLPAAGVS